MRNFPRWRTPVKRRCASAVSTGRAGSRERPIEYPKAVALDANVVRAGVEVQERERRSRPLELAFVRDEHRQRDREPFLRLGRASTRERRGPRKLPRLPERAPEPRVFHIVRPREGPRESLAPRRSVKSRVRTGRVARLYVRPRGHGPRPEILEQEHE